MPKGLSIHLGLNYTWGAEETRLPYCTNSAVAMTIIAHQKGFDWLCLLNEKATISAFRNAMEYAAGELRKNDILLLTYSGHGRKTPYLDGKEPNSEDENWVLYDGDISDNEIREHLKRIQKGVRVVVVADCCYASGFAMPAPDEQTIIQTYDEYNANNKNSFWKSRYVKLLSRENRRESKITLREIEASVILLAACGEHEVAEGDWHQLTLFTYTLVKVWDDGKYPGNYITFMEQIKNITPYQYSPQLIVVREDNPSFRLQTPFFIG